MCKVVQNVQYVQNCAKLCKMCKIVKNVQNFAKCAKLWKCAKLCKMCKIMQRVQSCAKYAGLHLCVFWPNKMEGWGVRLQAGMGSSNAKRIRTKNVFFSLILGGATISSVKRACNCLFGVWIRFEGGPKKFSIDMAQGGSVLSSQKGPAFVPMVFGYF